jgi:hypothetical protein
VCVAIYKPKGIQITKRYLKNSFDGNKDGAGFAIAKNGELQCFKGFFTFGEFWKAYKGYQSCAAVIHFRFATHGAKDNNNCHPFLVANNNIAVIHNGILDIKTEGTKSDTATFCELVLEPLFKQGVSPTCPAFKYLVETSIGDSNKLVLLLRTGRAIIFNEKLGVWKNGAWFSNEGFKSAPLFPWSWNPLPAKYSGDVKLTHGEPFPDYDGHPWDETQDREVYRKHGLSETEIDEALMNEKYSY